MVFQTLETEIDTGFAGWCLKRHQPLGKSPIMSKLRQPDNLERSSFKAKHSNIIAPLPRFQDVVWLHIHIYKYNVFIYIYHVSTLSPT